MNPITCAQFTEQLEELALGDIAEPVRGAMLAHASACRNCRGRLDEVLALTDSLLGLTPQHEPPPGFESRVLERLGVARSTTPVTTVQRAPERTNRRWILSAAAALVLVVATAIGVAVVRREDAATADIVRSGIIHNAQDTRTGTVELVDAVHPYALITIDRPRQRADEVTCELELADGSVVAVGSWAYADVKSNVWAVGIDRDLLDAVQMQIVDADGAVLSTATLTSD